VSFLRPVPLETAEPFADRCVLGVAEGRRGRPWRHRLDAAGEREALAIVQTAGVPDIVARVLAGRGVTGATVDAFLDPSIKALMPDPASLTDCERAAARLAAAVERGEAVAVFADYDVDGATSGALVASVLRSLGLDPVTYVPDRVSEGYGPSVDAIRRLVADGARLIVCVDCGSAAIEPLAEARRLGADVVVIDHHPVSETLAPAHAIVNPRRHDDLSGEDHLAAVGVTFIVMAALVRTLRQGGRFSAETPQPDLLAHLDLVALGTVCDVVPLKGLNRAFVAKGLKVMARRLRPGLTALSDCARLSGPPGVHALGFLLGPRINAGGRIGDAGLGLRLLMETDAAVADRIAHQLDRLNVERQAMETAALEEAEACLLAAGADAALPPVIQVAAEGWHPGVVGLLAARLKERYRRPAFAIALDGAGFGTGSARSIPGVDLGAAVRAAVEAGLLAKGGGHAMAAGVTVAAEQLGPFATFLEDRLAADVAHARAADALLIDAVLSAEGATEALADLLERAGPFGAGHPEPVFALASHRVRDVVPCGKDHLKVVAESPGGARIEAMAFRAAEDDLGALLKGARGKTLHLAGTLMADRFRGVRTVKLRLLDAALPIG